MLKGNKQNTTNTQPEENAPKVWVSFTPAILVGGLILLFIIFNLAFIDCPIGDCPEISTVISDIDSNKAVKFPLAKNTLTNLKTTSSNAKQPNTNAVNEDANSTNINKTNTNAPNSSGSNATTANTSTNTANVNISVVRADVDKLKGEVDKLKQDVSELKEGENEDSNKATEAENEATEGTNAGKSNANKAKKNKKTPAGKITAFRTNISSRYSYRFLWMFLTTIFFALFMTAIFFSALIIKEALEDDDEVPKDNENGQKNNWSNPLKIVAIIAFIAFSIAIIIDLFSPSIARQLFKQSIGASGDISMSSVSFFDASIFFAIVFLVAASCSLFYKVRELNHQTKSKQESKKRLETRLKNIVEEEELLTKKEKELSDEKLLEKEDTTTDLEEIDISLTGRYEKWRQYLRTILYIGGAMLFVGLLRINILTNWHLAFVSSSSFSAVENFFNNWQYIQALFYTILLAAIYLPISYSLPETSDEPSVEDSLKRKGFWATITTFAPRLIMIISPFLAGPVNELIKFYFGGE